MRIGSFSKFYVISSWVNFRAESFRNKYFGDPTQVVSLFFQVFRGKRKWSFFLRKEVETFFPDCVDAIQRFHFESCADMQSFIVTVIGYYTGMMFEDMLGIMSRNVTEVEHTPDAPHHFKYHMTAMKNDMLKAAPESLIAAGLAVIGAAKSSGRRTVLLPTLTLDLKSMKLSV